MGRAVQLRILGRVHLLMQAPVDVASTKVRGLLGYLSFRANEWVHVDRIAEALWDGDEPVDPGKALQTHASRLRSVLRSAGCPAELTNQHRSYRLELDQSTVDYHRFVSTIRAGHRARGDGDHLAAAEHFAAALSLWAGPPLADLDTQWARRFRETMTARHLIPAHCALFDTKLALGDHDFVLDELPLLLSDHPTDDRLAARWVRALVAADRAEEVPVFFREFASRLLVDLAVQPSSELVQAVRDATVGRPPPTRTAQRPAPPRGTSYFTGRDSIVEQLDRFLTAEDRVVDVVALDGPPGIGKTALVKHWARRRLERFPDGVLHADLAGYSDAPLIEPHAVMAMFLVELGVNPTQIPSSTRDRAAHLRHLLSGRAVLVVLDNVRDSGHVRPLLEATSSCPALITSRQRLTGITYRDGVRLLSIPALSPEEATELLAKRIGGRASDDPSAYVRLVELCQGLPLALGIVGEHVAMRPAAPMGELIDELRQTKRLLDAGSHGDDHATTLRSTFSLSYRALRPAERRLFGLLGLHPGARFSIHAVCALAGGTRVEVEYLLDALVGAHLVDQEGAGYYGVHDLLHMYAADTVQEEEPAPERARAIRRLFDWYLQSARRARTCLLGDDQDVPELSPAEPVAGLSFGSTEEALRWLLTERANLVACTYRAANLGYHGHVWRFGACLNVLSRYEDPRDLLDIHELGGRSAELAGDMAAVGGCFNNKGYIYVRLDDKTNAARCFALAHRAFTRVEDEHGLAVVTHNTGFVRLQMGQPAEAITWLTKALDMHRRSGRQRSVARSHRCLGDAYRMLDRFTEARSHYWQSLHLSQRLNDLAGQAKSLWRMAKLSLDEEDLEEVIGYGEAALAMFGRVHVDRDGTAAALFVLATAHLHRGEHSIAISMARDSVRRYQGAGNLSGQVDALILLGRALTATGELTEAARALAMAELILPADDPRVDVVRALLDSAAEGMVPAQRTQGAVEDELTEGAS
jgi:DNA-binding SARP family transcriptional activator/tetratricopeptide (TPR) repeat protein